MPAVTSEFIPQTDTQSAFVQSTLSTPPGSPLKHVVSPCGNGYVAVGLRLNDIADMNEITFDTGGVNIQKHMNGNVLTISIAKDAPARIPIKLHHHGTTLWKCIVWIVSANVRVRTKDLLFSVSQSNYQHGGQWTSIRIAHPIYFLFDVLPTEIVSVDPTADIPDLRGDNTVDPPSPPDRHTHILTGRPFELGADSKWDVSRRVRMKILNHDLVPRDVFLPFDFIRLQPIAEQLVTDFPTQGYDSVGNDDSLAPRHAQNKPFQSNTPYVTSGSLGMWNQDQPDFSLRDSMGNDGNRIELLIHFGEFARLQIGNRWQRISPFFDWRVHFRLRHVSGHWEDDGSDVAFDNNGF